MIRFTPLILGFMASIAFQFPVSADVHVTYDCTAVGGWSSKAMRQANIGLFVNPSVCSGGWLNLTASNGNDCDEESLCEDCNCPEAADYCSDLCVKIMYNYDKPMDWSITGYADRKVEFTQTYQQGFGLNDKCAVEAIVDYPTGGPTIIYIHVERAQADTYPGLDDRAGTYQIDSTVTVNPPPTKNRCVGYNPGISYTPNSAWATDWSKNARRDLDYPTWVNPGGTADNHECVEFRFSSITQDATIPTPDTSSGAWTTNKYNVTFIENFSDSNAWARGQKPGSKIVVTAGAISIMPRTLGHEWGHNGNLGDECTTLNIMTSSINQCNATYGDNIKASQTTKWSNQTASKLASCP